MFANLLQQIFLRGERGVAVLAAEQRAEGLCQGGIEEAVEQVVDQLHSRLRAVPNYARILKEPVAATFRYIDELAEAIPGPLLCSRSTFAEDPRVNAFFVSPQHIQEVFSQSEEVRGLFDANPLAGECWALLCMRKQERSQPGLALVNDEVRKDVMQTSVSFSDHQIVSPGIDEISARCALKCCMFTSLLSHVRRKATEARTLREDLENRLQVLNSRLRRLSPNDEAGHARLTAQIQNAEQELATQDVSLRNLKDHLDFIVWALSHPGEFLSAGRCALRLNRLAVKLEQDSHEAGFDLELSEIRIASHHPRIGALVRFPRDELLPQLDFLKRADLFLAL